MFKVVIATYNAGPWIGRCINSVLFQSCNEWEAVVVLDPSSDNTLEVASCLIKNDGRFKLICNSERRYMMYNRIQGTKIICQNDEDVVVFLDGDDWLCDNKVIEFLASLYVDPDVWLTWGSFIMHPSGKHGGAHGPLLCDVKEIRNSKWIFSHLKTAKYFLWKNIKDEDLRSLKTGEYYQMSSDMAYMYPMIEMAGASHIRHVKETLYVYNYQNPLNDVKVNHVLQRECESEIRSRPPYQQRLKSELLG